MWAAVYRTPAAIRELGILGGLCSAAVLVVTTAGGTQLLSHDGSRTLPLVYVLLAGVSIPIASMLSAALGRRPATAICRIACIVALGLCALLQGALVLQLRGIPLAICVTGYVLEIIFDTLFWLVVVEHLATRDLKRHTPALAMSFGIGGVSGGGLTSLFCQMFSADYLMLLALVLLGLSWAQCVRVSQRMQPLSEAGAPEDEPGLLDALRSTCTVLRTFPISRVIAVSIVLMSALFCLQDYLAMTIISMSFTDEDELARFMALVYAGQQAIEILVLAVFGHLIIERARPLIRNVLFPLLTATSLVALLACCTLPVAVLVSLNANAVSNGIFEPVKTMNYAAVPHHALPPLRMLLEGIVYPFGIALSGGGLLVLQTNFGLQTVLLVAIALSVLFLAASAAIGVMFVPSMICGLRLRGMRPQRYPRGAWTRRFSRSDALRLRTDQNVEIRPLGNGLARPALLRGGEIGADDPLMVSAPPVRIGRDLSRVLKVRERGASRSDMADNDADDATGIAALASGLKHAMAETRRATALRLARYGHRVLPATRERLDCRGPKVVEAAILALGTIRTRRARRIMRDQLGPLYGRARRNLAGLATVKGTMWAGDYADTVEVFSQALVDSNRAILRRVLAEKSALGNRRDVVLLHRLAETSQIRVRSNAVEALTSLPTGQLVRPLLSLLEPQAVEDVVTSAPPLGPPSPDSDAVLWTAAADDPWLRILVAPLLIKLVPFPRDPGETVMLDLVLFLKSVPLFKQSSLEDIARAAANADTVSLQPGEPVLVSTERSAYVYVVRSGSIELLVEDCVVDTLETGGLLGISALIGEESEDVAARTSCECVLVRFPVSVIADLAAEDPQVLWSVLRDITRVRRRSYERVAEAQRAEIPAPARPSGRSLQLVHDSCSPSETTSPRCGEFGVTTRSGPRLRMFTAGALPGGRGELLTRVRRSALAESECGSEREDDAPLALVSALEALPLADRRASVGDAQGEQIDRGRQRGRPVALIVDPVSGVVPDPLVPGGVASSSSVRRL